MAATTQTCKWCKHERRAGDDLELYCEGCGRRRIPLALLLIATWSGIAFAFFFSEFAEFDGRRSLFIVTIAAISLWISGLILRHRPDAIRRLLSIVIPTMIVTLHLFGWGIARSSPWPDWLSFLSSALALVAWLFLGGYVVNAIAGGFARARADDKLGTDTLILTVISILGLLVTVLHFALPSLRSLFAGWQSGLPELRHVSTSLAGLQAVVDLIEELRTQIGAMFLVLIVLIAVVRAFRDDYRRVGDFRATRTILRIVRRTWENIVGLVWGTLVRFWLIARRLLFLALIVLLSVVYLIALEWISEYERIMWTSTDFVGLPWADWLWFVGLSLCALLALFVMILAASHSHRESLGAIGRSTLADLPGLTKAVGFSLFVVLVGFWFAWASVIVYRMFTEHSIYTTPFRGLAFWIGTGLFVLALVLAIFVFKVDRKEERDGPRAAKTPLRQLAP